MLQYLELVDHLLDHGNEKEDRTGTGTLSTFGYQMRFDLSKGFPICTTKYVPFRAVVSELLWFLSGSSNVHDLRAMLHGEEYRDNMSFKTIWDDNYKNQAKQLGYTNGELGPIYGKQWRSWSLPDGQVETGIGLFPESRSIDQIHEVIQQIRNNPDSRRLIVSAWNPAEIDQMALPPCHCLFQFYIYDGKLSCQLYQRSADVFLGVPFNIASYALLTHMIAQVCNLNVGEFVWTGGDVHLYNNHLEQARIISRRVPMVMPLLNLNPFVTEIDQFTMKDIELLGYKSHPAVPAPMAV